MLMHLLGNSQRSSKRHTTIATATLIGALIVGCAFAGRLAQAGESIRLNYPVGAQFHRFASAVSGGAAIWTNPAALGSGGSPGGMFLYDYREPHFAKDRGLTISSRGIGYSYRKLYKLADDIGYSEHTFALAHQGTGGFSVGGSYRYVSEGPGVYHKRHSWNFGALYQKNPAWSLGLTLENINKSAADTLETEVEVLYSASARPLKTDQLTLSAELDMSHKQSLGDGRLRLGAEGSPIPGLYLYGSWLEDYGVSLGARVNFKRTFIGGQSRQDTDGDFLSATGYIGTVSQPQRSIVQSRSRSLNVHLGGKIEENPSQPVFGRKKLSFYDYLAALHRAVEDRSVSEVTVVAAANSLSWGQTQEIKTALARLSGAGKRVTVYLKSPGNRNYYLACSADRIILPPAGYLGLTGLYAEISFLGGTMEKIGVGFDSERIGAHKNAPEVFTETEPSAEYRETINRLLDNLYQQFVAEIARGRKITEQEARNLIDNGPYTSVQARDAGLVDELIYPDELRKERKKSASELLSVAEYVQESPAYSRWSPAPTIAVVVAEGSIGDDRSSDSETSVSGDITPQNMRRGFTQALANPHVRALTLRVNSPGGSAMASDLIFRESELAREKRPLTVSFGGVAASGGYYVSCAGDPVFANPGTITGSIGIFALKPILSGLYDKIDLEKHSFQRGANAGIFSLSKPFTDSERERVRSGLRAFYDLFVERVAAGRELSADSVNSLGEGRVWIGAEAQQNGLVDSIGGLWAALEASATEAGLTEFNVEIYPRRRSLFDFGPAKLLGPFTGITRALFGGSESDPALEALRSTESTNVGGGYLLRLPYDLVIE